MIDITMNINQDYIGTAFKKVSSFFKQEEDTMTGEQFLFLLEPVKDSLYNFIYKSLYYSEDAGDVYQETILRAYKYKKTYDSNAPFKTWIFSVAMNEIRYYFNKNKRTPAVNSLQLDEDIGLKGESDDSRLIRDIYEVAQQLKPKHQQVFFLFYDEGFSIKEISDMTGIREGNVKYILNQAREKIKEKLSIPSLRSPQ